MTATAIAWTIAISLWAGVCALAGVWVIRRVFAWYHSHGRSAAREPKELPSPATATLARRLSLLLVRRPLRDRAPQHEGAVPGWSPLAAVAAVTQAPELTTAPEQMVADHQALHTIGEAIAHFDQVIEAELDRFLAGMPLVRMRLPACVEKTGEMPMLVVTG